MVWFCLVWSVLWACGILVPQPGIKPVPPKVEAWSPNHWTARESPRDWGLDPWTPSPAHSHHRYFSGFKHPKFRANSQEEEEEKESDSHSVCPSLCDTVDCSPRGSSVRGIPQARILEWVPFSSPGDLPNPEIKPGLLHCRQILNCLSHQGSPVQHVPPA